MISNIVVPVPMPIHSGGGGSISHEGGLVIVSILVSWFILSLVVWGVDYVMRGVKDKNEWSEFINDDKVITFAAGVFAALFVILGCIFAFAGLIYKLIA